MSQVVSKDSFRSALGRFASGVTVVAVNDGDLPAGFTATAFSSVSLTPPLVLVCVAHRATAHDRITGAEFFGISILSERQAWIAEQCARSVPDRFAGVGVRSGGVGGAPLVEGALVALECRRHATHLAGDHTILVGEVVDVSLGEGEPLIHSNRRFGKFEATPLHAGILPASQGKEPRT